MEDFVHLHVHTYYSILDGQSSIKRLVDKAVANGMRGMAITDHGDMFGIKEFHDYVIGVNKGRKKEGLEPFIPIFGCEMYVSRYGSKLLKGDKKHQSGYHLIVLAKNYKGYKNLIKLVSNSWVDGYYMRPRTDREDLEKYHEGLIVCSACIAGEVPHKILEGDIAGAREAIEWYHRVFGDDYYLELQRHEVKDPSLRANRETFPLQQKANKVLIELAHEYGIKLVCTNDAHFVDQENAEAHDHLLCLSTGKDLDDPTRMLYSKQEWFKTREEMNEVFADVPEALSNTLEIMTLSCLSSLFPNRLVQKRSGVRSSQKKTCLRNSLVMRMARTSCHKKMERRKSRNWVAMISCIASSSRPTTWPSLLTRVLLVAMGRHFPRRLTTVCASSCIS